MLMKNRNKYAYFFIIPFFLTYLLFTVYPILYSFYLSFTELDPLGGGPTFIKLANYSRLFSSGYFFQSFINTLVIWIISIVPQLTLAMLLSLLLQAKWVRGRKIMRSIFYFPNLVTPVTIGVLFGMLFSHPGGAVNNVLSALHLTNEAIHFENSPILSRMVIGLAICWQNFGYNILFFTAGLNSISSTIYEAAEIDGANAWQKAFKITLPLMRPILIYVMITSIIGGLQMFDVSKMVFTDVPGDRTTTMVQYMYESAFERWQIGYGASVSYGIFLVIAVISLLSYRVISGNRPANVKRRVVKTVVKEA